jgi:small subunit ribosomal protein S6
MATTEEITFSNYEIALLISPETQEMDIQKIIAKLQNQIAQKGGRIFSTDMWGKQRLAYPIGKFEFGFYAALVFSYPTAGFAELTHDIKLMPEIIRHLALSLEKEGITPETMKRVDPFKEAPLSERVPSRPTTSTERRTPAPRTRTKSTTPAAEAPKPSEKDEATRMKELEEKLGKLLEEE